MAYTLHGARLVDASSDLSTADLTVGDRQIGAIRPVGRAEAPPDSPETDTPEIDTQHGPKTNPRHIPSDIPLGIPVDITAENLVEIDVSDLIVLPGFIDVHTHGGGGYNLHTADPAEIEAFARWVVSTGVTSFLIGVVGIPDGLPQEQLRAAARVAGDQSAQSEMGAEALGIHLEGPYISEQRRGAHLASWLRVPNTAETDRLLELAHGCLRIITLAPELDGAEVMIRRMVAAGVTVSIGHTDATYEQAREAIAWGARHATHCCNAMRPLHHRDPGPISAIVEAPEVYGELIADGLHVHPAMMRLLVKLLGVERTIVITDALAGAGEHDGTFEFNGQHASVVHGVARLDDGTITGSVLTMDQALRNVLGLTGVSLSEAVAMLSQNPAHPAGVADRKGRLAVGYDADLVLFDRALNLQATIRGGRLVFVTDAYRERLAGIPVALAEHSETAGAVPAALDASARVGEPD